MLLIARKVEQVVWIGDQIEVKVLGIRGDTVRLGITAPRQVPILRDDALVTERRPSPSHDAA